METNITVECPVELLVGLHVNAEGMSEMMKRKTAIALFKEGKISSGMAAKWLDLPRVVFLAEALAAGAELLEDSRDDYRRETALL